MCLLCVFTSARKYNYSMYQNYSVISECNICGIQTWGMQMIGSWIIVAGLFVMLMVLVAGLSLMLVGGPLDSRWSNALMRYHVLAQGMAFLVICVIGGISAFS